MRKAAFSRVGWALLILLCLSAATLPGPSTRRARATQRAELRLLLVDDDQQPLCGRVRIAPKRWAERVRLRFWRDLNLVVPERGRSIELPPGQYTIIASRGPEWSIVERHVEIEAHERVQHVLRLRHEVALDGWSGADLHVHTSRSEDAVERGGVRPSDLIAEGVGMAVATDHNQIGEVGPGIDSLRGAELTTWAPEVGHFNAFPLQALPAVRGTSPKRLFGELSRDPAVFVQVNHPRLEDHIAYFDLGGFAAGRFAQAGFHLDMHGLEVWNGYDLAKPAAVHELLAEWRGWLAKGHRLTATGGSDSHGPLGHRVGYPRTYVKTRGASGLAPALRKGTAFVTNGPLLHLTVDGQGPGEELVLAAGARVRVTAEVLAPSWMRVERIELWIGDELKVQQALPSQHDGQPLRYKLETTVDPGQARFVHAVVHGGSGLERLLGKGGVEPLAFTNAIYLTRASQPRVRR